MKTIKLHRVYMKIVTLSSQITAKLTTSQDLRPAKTAWYVMLLELCLLKELVTSLVHYQEVISQTFSTNDFSHRGQVSKLSRQKSMLSHKHKFESLKFKQNQNRMIISHSTKNRLKKLLLPEVGHEVTRVDLREDSLCKVYLRGLIGSNRRKNS